MKKTNWLADRESFRREWNATAKWNLRNRPDDEETHEYYDELKKPYAKSTLHHQQASSEVDTNNNEQNNNSTPKKRIHIRHKHKRVCPEHAQKLKERSNEASSSPNKHDETNNNNASATNRMIRQQPVTYTLNERSEELVKLGLARPEKMLLPGLHIPHVVGAGMCRMLTGGMPAHNARHFERRPNRDHPDFSKCTVDISPKTKDDKKVMTKQSLLSTKRGAHSVNAQDVGGFGTAMKMPPTSMGGASEYVQKNHAGGVFHTDQPSDDPMVLKQLHHSMKNRHRQWIPAVPKEVEYRAETSRNVVKRTVEAEEGDMSSSSSSSTSTSAQINNTTNNTKNASLTASQRAKLPKSNLIPRTHHHHHHQDQTQEVGDTTQKKKHHHHHRHSNEPIQPMLLRIPVDKTDFRKKDLIKVHHEAAHSVGGKVMMRGVKAV